MVKWTTDTDKNVVWLYQLTGKTKQKIPSIKKGVLYTLKFVKILLKLTGFQLHNVM